MYVYVYVCMYVCVCVYVYVCVYVCMHMCVYIHFINIYFCQHNYIIKAWVKANATCFDLKSHPQAKLRTMKFFT